MTSSPGGHVLHKCDDETCMVCLGGLASCDVCGGAEGDLPQVCPGYRMSVQEREATTQARLMGADTECMTHLERAFWRFHAENPDVLTTLRDLARQAKHAGARKYGIGALFEVLRWSRLMEKRLGEEFKLNNNYRAFYARLLMVEYPDLHDFFEIRDQPSETYGEVRA